MSRTYLTRIALALLIPAFAWPQDTKTVQQNLESALQELDAVRSLIKGESVALTRELNHLQRERVEAREEFDRVRGALDRRSLEINNLNRQFEARTKSSDYLMGLFNDYLGNWESRLHISEVPRYQPVISDTRAASENPNLPPAEKFRGNMDTLEVSLHRLKQLVGGVRFEGRAAGPDGRVKDGTFLYTGPLAAFASHDGELAGEAELIPNQSEAAVLDYGPGRDLDPVRSLVEQGNGELPFDASLGNARKLAATEETVREHMAKGGIVMFPLLGMFGIAMLIALYKWIAFAISPKPGAKQVKHLYQTLEQGDADQAQALVGKMKGNMAVMFQAGIEHLQDPKDLIEEVMYEKMLDTRFKLNRLLPFIAVCAASAPLLGLLGTVTGIINTFKLLTVFGSGDVKALSSGISEALITTEYGLIVAIPSLLAHAFLSRTAKSKMDRMEQSAILFLSAVETHRSQQPPQPPEPSEEPNPEPPPETPPVVPEALPA